MDLRTTQFVAVIVIFVTTSVLAGSTDGFSCESKCQNLRNYMSRWSRTQQYLDMSYYRCMGQCQRDAYETRRKEMNPTTPPPPPTLRPDFWRWINPVTTTTTTTTTTPNIQRPIQYGCGIRRTITSFIIGGNPTKGCEYPWMVALDVPNNSCGGTIIDKRHVLTAAHCLKDLFTEQVFQPSQVTVKFGSESKSLMTSMTAIRLYVHPNHNNQNKDYDVAVITLPQDLVFGPCVGPICLPQDDQLASDMDECVTAGWGILDPSMRDRYVPEVLQKVTLPLVNTDTCQTAWNTGYRTLVNDRKMCAGDYYRGGRDACLGDSGGPLMCRKKNGAFTEFGIVSFGNKCAAAYWPGVYTKVGHPLIMNFILQAINEG